MCEYCGCQEITAVGELTREHDEVVGLVAPVRAAHAAGEVETMAVLARRMAEILAPDTTVVVEEGLVPLMTPDIPEQVALLRSEHRHVEAVLGAAAGSTPADPDRPDALMEVLEECWRTPPRSRTVFSRPR
jgi:hypothetical protein